MLQLLSLRALELGAPLKTAGAAQLSSEHVLKEALTESIEELKGKVEENLSKSIRKK